MVALMHQCERHLGAERQRRGKGKRTKLRTNFWPEAEFGFDWSGESCRTPPLELGFTLQEGQPDFRIHPPTSHF